MESQEKYYSVIDLFLTRDLCFYEWELEKSSLFEHFQDKYKYFFDNVIGKDYRGKKYYHGSINTIAFVRIYSLIREFKPNKVVETGVCNGFSTAFILLALHKNGNGKLYSIDFPQVAGEVYEEGTFWEKHPATVIPKGKTPGWVIPEYLREPWTLILGKSQDKLPPLLKELQPIDFFIHDSEHSYECMWFEFEQAYRALKLGGVMASDEIDWNSSFYDFCKLHNKVPLKINQRMGFIVKGK